VKHIILAALVTLAILLVGSVLYARGPIGPESVLHKDVGHLIKKVAANTQSIIINLAPASPGIVPLSWPLKSRWLLKSAFANLGLVQQQLEVAEVFEVKQSQTDASLRCFVRVRGDHVIGLHLETTGHSGSFVAQFQNELKKVFPSYVVSISNGA